MVDKKYQCPSHCGVKHIHYVYFRDSELMDQSKMCIDRHKLGKRFKEKRKKKNKNIPMDIMDKPVTGIP